MQSLYRIRPYPLCYKPLSCYLLVINIVRAYPGRMLGRKSDSSEMDRHWTSHRDGATHTIHVSHTRAYLRGGGGFRGFKPPRNFQIFFLKSEGKEVERKRKKMRRDQGGGVLIVNIFSGG